jgi:ribosomal protein S18 acetylase RimI-like enzyme
MVATPREEGAEADPMAIVELFKGDDPEILDRIQSLGLGPAPSQYAWLASMAVAEERRRMGCATALLDTVHSSLEAFGCEWTALSVYPDNKSAIELYEQAGYLYAGTHGMQWLQALGGRARILMVRPREGVVHRPKRDE